MNGSFIVLQLRCTSHFLGQFEQSDEINIRIQRNLPTTSSVPVVSGSRDMVKSAKSSLTSTAAGANTNHGAFTNVSSSFFISVFSKRYFSFASYLLKLSKATNNETNFFTNLKIGWRWWVSHYCPLRGLFIAICFNTIIASNYPKHLWKHKDLNQIIKETDMLWKKNIIQFNLAAVSTWKPRCFFLIVTFFKYLFFLNNGYQNSLPYSLLDV